MRGLEWLVGEYGVVSRGVQWLVGEYGVVSRGVRCDAYSMI